MAVTNRNSGDLVVVQPMRLDVSACVQYSKEMGSNVSEVRVSKHAENKSFLVCPLYRLPQDGVAQIKVGLPTPNDTIN